MTQYQKHLIKDMLEEAGTAIRYDANELCQLAFGRTSAQSKKIEYVTLQHDGDQEFKCTPEAIEDIQKQMNSMLDDDSDNLIKDKMFLARSELFIILHKNGEILLKLPYSYTSLNSGGVA
ncbi:MAG: hypothetical protein KDC67_08340 [Ignavibacteriae bacterium]|nr:hypothetical protein [Ignavibacteriota bacterium]